MTPDFTAEIHNPGNCRGARPAVPSLEVTIWILIRFPCRSLPGGAEPVVVHSWNSLCCGLAFQPSSPINLALLDV